MPEFIKRLLRRLDPLRGFLTIPGLITLSGFVLALITMQIDVKLGDKMPWLLTRLLDIDYGPAQTLLSALTSATMTALSLVYSSVLVVFTLAAGTVGPRLLQRFSEDRLSQIAVGMLGATFLFSLVVLRFTSDGEVHRFSIFVAVLLATTSILLLLIFVNAVAKRVTIDEEVAAIATELDAQINDALDDQNNDETLANIRAPDGPKTLLRAREPGYVSYISEDYLVSQAGKAGLFVEVLVSPGDYVLTDMPIMELTGTPEESAANKLHDGLVLARSRTPEGDLRFSVHLMVEIALRALSPGVNDSYTAIVCIDRLSSSVAWARRNGLHHGGYADETGVPRLKLPALSADDLLVTAFSPIRRNARGNAMVISALIDAMARIAEVSGRAKGDAISDLLVRLGDEIKAGNHIAADAADLTAKLEAVERRFYPSLSS